MVEHLLEAVKIEAVSDVLFVHFGEEGVVVKGTEPANPAIVLLRAVGVTR